MPISLADIEAAHKRIRRHIHRTPVLTCQSIDKIAGANLFFKCENFQKIGAFKIRGGMNAALTLSKKQLKNGLATHSSGNHAYIVMPNNSPSVKINAVRGYGAEITFCEPNQAARESTIKDIIERTGAEFVHPYDDDRVITGQATAAKELIEDTKGLDIVIAPVGGGGLLSGTCLSTHYLLPNALVYAGEPEGAADAVLSIKSGKLESAPYIKTIADGLLTKLSDRTFTIIKNHVTDIFTVNDDEIIAALRLVYERMKIIIEPSCAVPLAAILKNPEAFSGKKVGIILSGGNVDIAVLATYFNTNHS
jgi:threonine dehydratase